jgi:hypothetical protein
MSEVIDISKVNAALAESHAQLGCNGTELANAIRAGLLPQREGVNAMLAKRIASARREPRRGGNVPLLNPPPDPKETNPGLTAGVFVCRLAPSIARRRRGVDASRFAFDRGQLALQFGQAVL